MSWIAQFWNRILTAFAGAGGTPNVVPPEGEAPPEQKIDPQADRDPTHNDVHTWKAHGGDRH